MGQFGRLTSVKDLPRRRSSTPHQEGDEAQRGGVKAEEKKVQRAERPVPPELAAALAKNKKARADFEAFPPSHRREYNEWIGEAKREETRAARVAQAMEWIAEGKARNWKYEKR